MESDERIILYLGPTNKKKGHRDRDGFLEGATSKENIKTEKIS